MFFQDQQLKSYILYVSSANVGVLNPGLRSTNSYHVYLLIYFVQTKITSFIFEKRSGIKNHSSFIVVSS